MNIREYIIEKELAQAKERHKRLCQIGAHALMIKSSSERIEELEQGVIKFGGEVVLLWEEVEKVEPKKYSGGKTYVVFNDSILYFPTAKYGRFIKRADQ